MAGRSPDVASHSGTCFVFVPIVMGLGGQKGLFSSVSKLLYMLWNLPLRPIIWQARFMGRWVDWKPVMQEASKAEEVGGDMPVGALARHSHLMSRRVFFQNM